MNNVIPLPVDRSHAHGVAFHDRIQRTMYALAHWRSLILLEMTAPDVDDFELGVLQMEIAECLRIMLKLAKSGERLKVERGDDGGSA